MSQSISSGSDHEHGLLYSVITNKCPHCRTGDLFKEPNPYHLSSTMKMPEHCPECGQRFELQTGFYYGTGYISYAISVVIIGLSFALWYFTIGFSLHDDRIFWWLGSVSALLVILQPVLQRLCRSIWISMFVKYDPFWRSRQTA